MVDSPRLHQFLDHLNLEASTALGGHYITPVKIPLGLSISRSVGPIVRPVKNKSN